MNKQLHILFLCGWYPSRVLPTNGDFIQRHAEAVAMKHKVTVLHLVTDRNAKKNISYFTKNSGNLTVHIGYIKKTNVLKKVILFIKAFFFLLKKMNSIDVIHLNEIYPFGVFALYLNRSKSKTPYIISEHWTGYHFPQSKNIGIMQKILSKMIVKNASFVCPVADNLADSMKQLGFNGNYCKVPNVVDTEVFTPIKNTNKTFTIIHISSLFDAHKNVSGMLKVAKLLENEIGFFTWKFIGGSDKNYKNLLKKLNFETAKIEFIAHIPQQEMAIHLQEASVFVLFSNYENLPCVILESFSCGIPVISTKVGGISEFFPEDFGKLISQKSKKELLASLLFYSKKTTENKEKMHTYAVTNFSKETIQKMFSNWYYQSLKVNS